MPLELEMLVNDFAGAFKAVDATAPRGASSKNIYQAGVGPLAERDAVGRALAHLRAVQPETYHDASPSLYPHSRQVCDLVIPGEWAIEFKLLRPFGDNGKQTEHWSENLLHPYLGNVSSIGDCLKLRQAQFVERKGVLVYSFEHDPPQLNLEVAIAAFELIARQILAIPLGNRCESSYSGLMHPYHQRGTVYGWEVR